MATNAEQKPGNSRIFFYHMSIGGNVISGLQRLPHDNLAIAEINLAGGKADLAQATLNHAFFGQNGDPLAKIDLFKKALNEGLNGEPDIALMKLCFADFYPSTDAENLFKHYADTIAELKKQHPQTTFIHVTAPLLPKDTGAKEFIKNTFGVKDGNAQANVQRGKYNQLLRTQFANEPIFDLAGVESTWPDGRKETFTRDGKVWQSLVPAYTNDGAHLDGAGQERAAAELLKVLKSVLKNKNP